MKYFLYVLIGIITLVVGFFIWFYAFFLKVPELKIAEDASKAEKIATIHTWMQDLQKDGKFNGGVLFLEKGHPVIQNTYGYTNGKKTEELTANSSFRLASVSKQFTAAGIMLLKAQQKLEYEDLVVKYIEGFPYPNVTIRHLLNQTSGVPDSYMDLATKKKKDIEVLSNAKAVQLVVEGKLPADFKPNEKYQYSNTNYILLARIVEVISSESFEDFMKKELFIPLQMNDTRVWNLLSKDKTFKGKTSGFDEIGELEEVAPSFIDGVAGDGAVFSSLEDFKIWDQFWYQNELISDQQMEEAFKTPVLSNAKASNYGFGWVVGKNGVVWHNGSWLAARTYIKRNTKEKTCLVVLDNSSNLFFDKIVDQLEKYL